MILKKEQIVDFLESVNYDFNPPLTEKVNLSEYVEKILSSAHLIYRLSSENKLIGLVVLYCNNIVDLKSYIALVAVRKDYRGKGLAKDMMKEAIEIVKNNKYLTLGIHSNNEIAISLYMNLGFTIKENGDRKYLELVIANNK